MTITTRTNKSTVFSGKQVEIIVKEINDAFELLTICHIRNQKLSSYSQLNIYNFDELKDLIRQLDSTLDYLHKNYSDVFMGDK
jgi:hypothetical protein